MVMREYPPEMLRIESWEVPPNVPEYQNPVQLRSAGDGQEVRAASLQFVRKITGFNKPSKANEAAFLAAVDEIAAISARLLRSLDTNAPAKNREEEAAKAKARAAERFGA
jgi:hypothetical protein